MRWLAAAAAIAIACGRGGSATKNATDAPPAGAPPGGVDPGAGGTKGAAPCNGFVTVRLRGVDEGTIGTFDADLAALFVNANGSALAPSWSASGTLSLVGVDSDRLAVLESAAGETIEVTLRLGRVHVCEAPGCVDLDLCTEPVSFRFDTDKVSPDRCDVVLHLDLAKSVQPLGGGKAFLPRFSVHY